MADAGAGDAGPGPSLNSVVTLNVGGTSFVTTRQTLLNDPNSMLAKMFDPVSPLQPGVLHSRRFSNLLLIVK